MPIIKSTGTTPTETLLASLCERSFLKLWSYPNPFKDDGNELCDLLVVFENRVFIFFDREGGQLEDSEADPALRWERWKRKVIDAQVRSAHGAQRYIESGRSIFLDAIRTVPFPLNIDPTDLTVHKIVVAHGAKEACKAASDQNVYGSLAISYGKTGRADRSLPFMIHLDKTKPVHVFDSHNLSIILGELDTVSDLSAYLDAKIAAIRNFDGLLYCGEEDLLGHYLFNFDEATKTHFIGTKDRSINAVLIGEGEWQDFIKLDLYQRKKSADRISYLWDELIQKTAQNALDGTLLGNADLLRGKSAIHEMAKEPRFMRRALADKMLEAMRNFPETPQPLMRNLSFMPSFYPDKGYVFLQLKAEDVAENEAEHRQVRQAMLEIACGAAKNKFPQLKTVIGIAIDAPKFVRRNSEDFILLDCENWTDADRQHFEECQ